MGFNSLMGWRQEEKNTFLMDRMECITYNLNQMF